MAEKDELFQPAGEPALRDLLAAYPVSVQKHAMRLRELVLAVLPPVVEQVDPSARLIGYGFDRSFTGTICVILLAKNAVKLGLPRGVGLPDPTGLLAGSGKRARHVQITAPEQIEQAALRELIAASAAQIGPGAGEQ